MSDSFLAAFDKLADLGDAPSNSDVAAALASVPADADTVAGSDSPAGGAETVQGGQDAPAGGDSIDGGAETVQGGQDAPADGQDALSPEPARGGQDTPDDTDEFIGRLRRLVTAQPADTTTAQPAAQPPAAPPLLSQDEQALLTTYEQDWPDVARAEAIRRRVEYTHLLNHVYSEVANFLKPHLEMLDALATRTHVTDLTTREPDYDTVRDQVVEWVKQQPKYLQPAYSHVIEQGTADEIVDLIGRWREATKQPAATSAAPAPKPKDTALPPAAIKAAAAMAPVVSKRSAPTAGVDPGDFNSAFEAAAAAADQL